MATQAIDATIFASSHPDIAKRTSISGLLISCVMLLIGIYLLLLLLNWKINRLLSVWL